MTARHRASKVDRIGRDRRTTSALVCRTPDLATPTPPRQFRDGPTTGALQDHDTNTTGSRQVTRRAHDTFATVRVNGTM